MIEQVFDKPSFRWEALRADDGPKLFGETRRVPGKGVYRGLEFIEVEARSIINTLPDGNPLPFRHTINAYRGCSHACTFCFARPTHEYLGFDRGADFESKIVVKVNAPELLRSQLGKGWSVEGIAMGTNTDPYQPAEGKYRLTRRLVEVLVEHRNPFSVLTKSSLALRDLDLFVEAARHDLVHVDFSIGTLDDAVWRQTEPGTPHPRRRIEAVRRLNDAGVPSGVLMAPILPGLSDRPEQLDAVVEAAIDAGARFVAPILLHLRRGVRDHYLEWLRTAHPELLDRYLALYPRAGYARPEHRKALSRLIAELVAGHGGDPKPRAVETKPAPMRAWSRQQALF
jgi:DNA repair photolyase